MVDRCTDELIIPIYKKIWADIRRTGRAPGADGISFMALEYPQDI